MKYSVAWLPAAAQELAEIWLAADDRPAVSQAAALLERQIAIDAESVGESRPDGRRIHFAAPLGIPLRIQQDDRRVVVIHAWSFKRRKPK